MQTCSRCNIEGKKREFVVNEYDEHEVLCNDHYIVLLEGLALITVPDCPSKGKGFKGYRYNPKKIVIVEKVVENHSNVRRRRRR